MHTIFENAAPKVKVASKVLLVVGCLVAFILGCSIWDDVHNMWLYAILIWVVGFLISYLSSLLLYMFAQIAEDLSFLRKKEA